LIIQCEHIATDDKLSKKFCHWPAKMCTNRLSDSADLGQIESNCQKEYRYHGKKKSVMPYQIFVLYNAVQRK